MDQNEWAQKKIKGWVMESGIVMEYINKNFQKDAAILDIGCGFGHFLRSCLENGYKNLSGTDIENRLIFEEVKNAVNFKPANLNKESLPFSDGSFDIVTSFEVFEHLENAFHFARECWRVLKPGGKLIFSYPYGWGLQSRIKFLLNADVVGYRPSNYHINFLTKEIFDKCFYRDKKFKPMSEFYYRGKIKLFGREIFLPANKYFGSGVCYIMEKN